ncbi:class I SAM-dependent methyltransferase [Flavobacterium muglaense]|uniref:Class I SAM-dependent methyltransferase n=1 Tax=Flavobacterium muglaense TaxID=2764716 RepID=A0A923N2Q8_9FLAO|nr:class I SAM-dependent methyltransferase [Flavobacterium muglaense]MBC5838492.1 class I SAM-dependent methyltransferase [Flavobacterium muglaense]MBC5844985.1 class I SAM-dependent methyltransferase [Flavobacterium muglaense]
MDIEFIKKTIKKETFDPGIIGFFINYNFLIRKSIQKAIKSNASKLEGSLLDFGCGTKPYKKLFVNVKEYLGVDYKIEGREQNYSEVDAFYDGKNIPFENEKFDSLLCTEVLEHVFNIDELLVEFHRVLKNDGLAIITTPFMWEEHEMPYDFARYTTPALKYLYERNGFKVIDHFKTGNYIEVIFQFNLNYIKNILPNNKVLRQFFLLPFILFFNTLGLFFSFILPVDKTAYFNNVFILEKIS